MKFEKIYIELSDICNLKCGFCPSIKGVRGAMSVEDFTKIAEKVAGKGRIYAFHLLGDPLILPNLNEFIKVAKDFKMPVELTTSGFYMNEKNIKLLLESENVRQINFSLMAFLAQKNVSFKAYFEPILAFLHSHLALKRQNFVNLRLWNLDKNFRPPRENDDIYALLEREFNVKIDKFASKNRLANRIILHQASKFQWASLQSDFDKAQNGSNAVQKSLSSTLNDTKNSDKIQGSCYALKKQIAILSTGVVTPCCMDSSGEMALGELLRQDLDEILRSPRALMMKKGFERGEFIEPLCQNCEFGRNKTLQKFG